MGLPLLSFCTTPYGLFSQKCVYYAHNILTLRIKVV